MSLSSTKIGIIELVICALIWSSLGVIVRSLPYSSLQLVEFRVLIALPIMLVFWYSKSGLEDIKKKEHRTLLIILGIAITVAWSSYFTAFKLTTIANTVVLLYTGPIFVAIFAPYYIKERKNPKANISLLIAVVGMIFLFANQGLGDRLNTIGLGLGLLSGILLAFIIMTIRKLSTSYSSWTLAITPIIVTSIILLPTLFTHIPTPTNTHLILIFTLGIVHTAFAYYLYVDGIARITAQRASIITYTEPASAIIFAAVLINEIPDMLGIIGITLIIVANLVVNR